VTIPRFKLVRIIMGSGWPSGHVAVDRHYRWPEKPGGDEICLTLNCETAEELSGYIDELIGELETIRAEAPEKFARWKREWIEQANRTRNR
jgi:hypothetical protein